MPETPPTILAVDYFDAAGKATAAKFPAQNSDTAEVRTVHEIFGPSGNYVCSNEIDDGDTFMTEYGYCGGGSPDIDADMTVWVTAFGDVYGSGVMDEMRVHFEAGMPATVTIDGHQHNDNPHVLAGLRSANVSGIIPGSAGVGVPSLITVSTANTSPVSADITFNAGHVDKPGADGKHFYGQNITCKVTLSVNYEGTIARAGLTAGNWLNIVIANAGAGTDTPTSSITAEQYVDWS